METGSASPRALVAVAQTSDAATPQSPPVADVADLGLLAHEAHDGAEELAHALRRRVLLKFQ